MGVSLGFFGLVPLHVLAKVAGQRDLVPPLFLGTMGRMAGLKVRTEGTPRRGALLLANHVGDLTVLRAAMAAAREGIAPQP